MESEPSVQEPLGNNSSPTFTYPPPSYDSSSENEPQTTACTLPAPIASRQAQPDVTSPTKMICFISNQTALDQPYTVPPPAYQTHGYTLFPYDSFCPAGSPFRTNENILPPFPYPPPSYLMVATEFQEQPRSTAAPVANIGEQRIVYQQVRVNQPFVAHVTLACFTFLCCGFLFGIAAFILAVVARSRSRQDPVRAVQLGRASVAVSITGIIIFVVFVATLVIVSSTMSRLRHGPHDDPPCSHSAVYGSYMCE